MNPHFLNKRLSHQLGYAGLLPFVFMLFGVWFADASWLQDFVKGQLAYGIVILSFLGGVHWGAGMLSSELSAVDTKKALMWGVTPSLIAWSATLFGGFGFAVLMAGFVLLFAGFYAPLYLQPGRLASLSGRADVAIAARTHSSVTSPPNRVIHCERPRTSFCAFAMSASFWRASCEGTWATPTSSIAR